MGRFISKFSPVSMAQTAKQLVFGKSQEVEVRNGDKGKSVMGVEGHSGMLGSAGKRKNKRDRNEEGDSYEGMAVRNRDSVSSGSEIRLFGKNIRIENGESSKPKARVEKVYTLGELIRRDKLEVMKRRAIAVRPRTEPIRQFTAVTRDSLSPGVGLLEGKGDNFKGTASSPSTTISHIFTHFFGCFGAVGFSRKCVEPSAAVMIPVTRDASQGFDHFSFHTPSDSLMSPYDPVEEWWPRRASPSLQYSVTHVDPYMERHPVWMER